ncbi:hypothetical protein NL676_032987 [Syzygium grande]|nr:hypothetical protein NL676_032987 [Syzygium grande]
MIRRNNGLLPQIHCGREQSTVADAKTHPFSLKISHVGRQARPFRCNPKREEAPTFYAQNGIPNLLLPTRIYSAQKRDTHVGSIRLDDDARLGKISPPLRIFSCTEYSLLAEGSKVDDPGSSVLSIMTRLEIDGVLSTASMDGMVCCGQNGSCIEVRP